MGLQPRKGYFINGMKMSGQFSLLFILGSLILISGCMSPRTQIPLLNQERIAAEALRQQTDFLLAETQRSARIQNAAFPILKAAAELFPEKTRYTLGIAIQSDRSLMEPYREAAEKLWGQSDNLRISNRADQSPAALAGIEPNDKLIAINNLPAATELSECIQQLRQALESGNPIELTLLRNGESITLSLSPVKTATYPIQLRHKSSINALATPSKIEINRGMLDFCQNETELAYVIAHEIAHLTLKHHRAAAINFLTGLLGDATLWATLIPSPGVIATTTVAAKSESYEAEADYIALYLLTRAGHDPANAANFWHRLATVSPVKKPRFKLNFKSHPDLPTRQILFEETLSEIKSNPALKPHYKSN